MISMLEQEVERLSRDLSSCRNPPIAELKKLSDMDEAILCFLMQPDGRTIDQIARHVGESVTRCEDALSNMPEKMVYIQHSEDPSRWCLGTAGKRYIVGHGLGLDSKGSVPTNKH